MRRLYIVIGIMSRGISGTHIMPGIVLAENEDEATGAHVKWMKEQKPLLFIDSVNAQVVNDELVHEAMKELTNNGQ